MADISFPRIFYHKPPAPVQVLFLYSFLRRYGTCQSKSTPASTSARTAK
nr:MAG TPA: hypothetical protein [Bacteriophage sp.]